LVAVAVAAAARVEEARVLAEVEGPGQAAVRLCSTGDQPQEVAAAAAAAAVASKGMGLCHYVRLPQRVEWSRGPAALAALAAAL